jgi:GT2 family glycosyltransferase
MISFVLLEYHSKEMIPGCLENIRKKTSSIDYEVIIVCNSAYNFTQRTELNHLFPWVRWVFNEKNLGFAGGMNSGIHCCSPETAYIIIMNLDCTIRDGFLCDCVHFMDTNEKVGIFGPIIVNRDGNLQDSARHFLTPLRLIKRQWKRWSQKKIIVHEYEAPKIPSLVDWVIGAFMFVSCKAIDEVGLLDDKYFLYVEDMDWCMRFKKFGYQVFYYPDLVVEFEGDRKSTNAFIHPLKSKKFLWFHIKGLLRFWHKYYTKSHR